MDYVKKAESENSEYKNLNETKTRSHINYHDKTAVEYVFRSDGEV